MAHDYFSINALNPETRKGMKGRSLLVGEKQECLSKMKAGREY